jgi:hypothetical protein
MSLEEKKARLLEFYSRRRRGSQEVSFEEQPN